MRLQDRVAIVTGGGIGIGKVYSRALAAEGARVVVADIAAEAAEQVAVEIVGRGGQALAVRVDVTSVESTEAMARQAVERFGQLDVLVNNAALFTGILPKKSFDQIGPDEWDRVMAVNTKGPFLCVKAVYPYFRERRAGKIINIASVVAFSGAPGFVHYVASKAAVIGFTRALARELGPHNVTVNAIAPGVTASETAAPLIAEEDMRFQVQARAIKRVQVPEDIAGAVVFLASPDSDFITGQTLVVDGGLKMH
ncbi:MAG: 3-oxoacyl-ACP reductase FabG [Chloroflexi bacterium]|nr:3-oxoacyl-ACP reductase FabG [Chloroflexota bacterium]